MKVEIELNECTSWPHYAVSLRDCFQNLIGSLQYNEQPYEGEVRKLYDSNGRSVGELTVVELGEPGA